MKEGKNEEISIFGSCCCFRDKEPAKPGDFAWLFGPRSRDGTEKGAGELVKAIKAAKDAKLVLGDMEYSLVKDNAFIQRKPIKQEKAR